MASINGADRARFVRRALWYGLALGVVCWCAAMPLVDGNLSLYFSLMMWATLATGINFIAGFAGYIPFGYVAFYGIGAYAAGVAVKVLGLSIYLAVPAAGAFGVFVALLFAPALRLSGIYFAIVSLALAIICQRVVSLLPDEVTGGSHGIVLGVVTVREQGYYGTFAEDVTCYEEFPETVRNFRVRHVKWTRGTCEFLHRYGLDLLRSRRIPWSEKLDILFPTANLPVTLFFFLYMVLAAIVLLRLMPRGITGSFFRKSL